MTVAFFTQLIITTLAYVVLFFAFLGIGMCCSKITKIAFPFEYKPFSLIWLGWGITLLFLQVVNLVSPINAYISIPILIFGVITVIKHFKFEFWSKLIYYFPKGFIVLGVAVILWIASLSMQLPSAYDSGLYHFNSIRWLNEFPIVLGLGNLHGRLAFNQSFFSYVAFLNVYPLFNFGFNLANSFLLLILLLECLFCLSKFIASLYQGANIKITEVIIIFFAPVLIYLAQFGSFTISTPSPDITSSIVQILIFIYFLRAIDRNTLSLCNDSQTLFVLIMSATAVTIKLSNLFFVLSICLMLLLFNWKLHSIPLKQILSAGTKLLILPVIIILVWILRGVLLSGCPAYPSTIGYVNTSWSVPIAAVKSEADWIYSWARLPKQPPDKVLNSWAWLVPWFNRVILSSKTNILTVIYPLLIFIAITTAGCLLFPRRSKNQREALFWLLIPLPVLGGLFFWFYLAPEPRFAGALFLILPISATVTIFKYLQIVGKLKVWIILLLFFVININIGIVVIHNRGDLIRISAFGNIPLPTVDLTEKTTISGLNVLVPANGNKCWDSKIPCTPYFSATLNFKNSVIFPEFFETDPRHVQH